jgi:valyl-tRNA synthetase
MMMMGLYTQDQIPFERIYIHALVRDEKGQKMSKTRGNVLDPLDLIEDYGADALRFTLAISAAPGRDIKIGKSKVEQYRNFLTKIWNAARFLMMQDGWSATTLDAFDPSHTTLSLSHWILSKLSDTHHTVTQALNEFRFDVAAQALYHFVWGTYCDFFLEFMKPIMGGEDESSRTEILCVARFVFHQILLMMEPFAPFLTQHLWEHVLGHTTFLCEESWSTMQTPETFAEGTQTINHLQSLIVETRALRSMYRVPAGSFIEMSESTAYALDDLSLTLLKRMARVSAMITHDEPKGDILLTVGNIPYKLSLGDSIDLSQERQRIKDEIESLAKDLTSWKARFNNPDFRSKAKDEIVEELNARIIAAENDIAQKRAFLG